MFSDWVVVLAAIELVSLLVFGLSIVTAAPEEKIITGISP
jgi:hypothetical protein